MLEENEKEVIEDSTLTSFDVHILFFSLSRVIVSVLEIVCLASNKLFLFDRLLECFLAVHRECLKLFLDSTQIFGDVIQLFLVAFYLCLQAHEPVPEELHIISEGISYVVIGFLVIVGQKSFG